MTADFQCFGRDLTIVRKQSTVRRAVTGFVVEQDMIACLHPDQPR
jgi:hypothetical protein